MKKSLMMMFGLFAALSLLLVACGGTQQSSGESSDEATEKLLEPGKFHFAMSGVYKPYNYVDENNELVGFDVEIANEISKRLELEPVPQQLPWDSLIMELRSGKFDAIAASMSITEDRLEQVDFTRPYYNSYATIFVNENNSQNIQSADDLQGKKVGVVTPSTFKDAALELVGEDGEVSEYTSDLLALEELKSEGRIDAVITDLGVGMHAIDQGLPAIAIGDPLFVDKIGIAVQKGNQALLDELNEALESMIEDGTYLEISEKWFNEDLLAEK